MLTMVIILIILHSHSHGHPHHPVVVVVVVVVVVAGVVCLEAHTHLKANIFLSIPIKPAAGLAALLCHSQSPPQLVGAMRASSLGHSEQEAATWLPQFTPGITEDCCGPQNQKRVYVLYTT